MIECPIEGCNREFKSRQAVGTHLAKTHPNKQKFSVECKYCGKITKLTYAKAQDRKYCSESCAAKDTTPGRTPWNKGIPLREQVNSKEALKNIESTQFEKDQEPWNKGLTKENNKTIRKISKKVSTTLKNRNLSKDHKLAIKRGCQGINQGTNNGMYGKTHSQEIRERISEKISGENHYKWKEGTSPYPKNWSEIRDGIRVIYHWTCARCGAGQNEILDVHHKDGDKKNNNLSNLILLCRSCHAEVENSRDLN